MEFNLALAQYPLLKHESEADWKNNLVDFCHQARSAQILSFPEYGSLDLTSLLSEDERRLENQVGALKKFLPLFMDTFAEIAKDQKQYILAPSIPVIENAKPINRAYFFGPDGLMGYQDKQKMTRFENEDWKIYPGDTKVQAFTTSFGKIGISICYDVEFPRFARELAKQDVQLLLAPSCTETLHGLNRVHVGARARALENQFYVGVSQTVGEARWSPAVDINTGQALLCGPPDLGFPEDGIVANGSLNQPGWLIHQVDLRLVENVRSKGAVFNWKDSN